MKRSVQELSDRDELGKGSNGTVYKKDDRVFKVFSMDTSFKQELNAHIGLRIGTESFEIIKNEKLKAIVDEGYSYIAKCYGGYTKSDEAYVLEQELAQGKEFGKSLFEENGIEKITYKDQTRPLDNLKFLKQAAKAIAAMHEAGIVCRDIKAENMMIDNDNLKLIDLGSALDLKDCESKERRSAEGSARYMAPEAISGLCEKGISPAVDVFALGVVIMESLLPKGVNEAYLNGFIDEKLGNGGGHTRKEFLNALNSPDEIFQNMEGGYSENQKSYLCNLLKDCLATNPEDRPSAAQVSMLLKNFPSQETTNQDYAAIKKGIEEDLPKTMPIAMQILSDDSHRKNLVTSDSSYKI